MSNLSTAQITVLRSLDTEDEYRPTYEGALPARTVTSLRRRGLIKHDTLALTTTGLNWVRSYVRSSGNGPEYIKAMFRF